MAGAPLHAPVASPGERDPQISAHPCLTLPIPDTLQLRKDSVIKNAEMLIT